MTCIKSNIFSSMTRLLKAVTVSLLIGISLTSDTASRSAVESAPNSSVSSVSFAAIGQMPKSWGCRSWTSQEAMLPSESRRR